MQNPRNLRVYGQALQLALGIYRLTSVFPSTERFGLVAQMRRAAVSVGSNIAEGCGRNGNRALMAFLHHALGSLVELELQVEISKQLGFCAAEDKEGVRAHLTAMRRGIIALIAELRRRPDVPDGWSATPRTYPPTHLPTYPPTHLPTYPPTHLPTYPPTFHHAPPPPRPYHAPRPLR